MDQVFLKNKTDKDIEALWDNKVTVIEAGGFLPVERGIADVWVKHYGDNKLKGEDRVVYLEVKEIGDLVLSEKTGEVKEEKEEKEETVKPKGKPGRPKKTAEVKE